MTAQQPSRAGRPRTAALPAVVAATAAPLDIGTAAKRERVATIADRPIDQCADRGFNVVEPDNHDSYSRSDHLLTADDATAFITLPAAHAHARHLAIAQKNTAQLTGIRSPTNLDFAVAEECAEHDDGGTYASAFHDRVGVIDYTEQGPREACSAFGDRVGILRRAGR